MTSFKVKTKDVIKTLNHLKVVVPKKGKRALKTMCEITLTDGRVKFIVPGAEFYLECLTNGACKVAVPYWSFYNILKTIETKDVKIILEPSGMRINKLTLNTEITFFETDRILRSIDLTANYSDKDLLLLKKEGYTWEELEFNNLNTLIYSAQNTLNMNLDKVYLLLNDYGITYEDLEGIVNAKLGMKINQSFTNTTQKSFTKLNDVFKLLQPYGVNYEEIKQLVVSRIKEI